MFINCFLLNLSFCVGDMTPPETVSLIRSCTNKRELNLSWQAGKQ